MAACPGCSLVSGHRRRWAPSRLGSFLRLFTFGHVRQLDAVADRLLAALTRAVPALPDVEQLGLVDIDDTVRQTYGYAKQGAGRGAARLLTDALATLGRCGATGTVLVRADSAYYGHDIIAACRRAAARFSVTARLTPAVTRAITT